MSQTIWSYVNPLVMQREQGLVVPWRKGPREFEKGAREEGRCAACALLIIAHPNSFSETSTQTV